MEGRESQGVWGGRVHTTTLKTDNQQPRDLDRKGKLEENVYVWLSPFAIHLKLS